MSNGAVYKLRCSHSIYGYLSDQYLHKPRINEERIRKVCPPRFSRRIICIKHDILKADYR